MYTINPIHIEFGPAKDIGNIAKHGVSLRLAEKLEWQWLLSLPDERWDYREQRHIGFAPIDQRVYCVVFTDRGKVRRIISLRKANQRETKRYAESQT